MKSLKMINKIKNDLSAQKANSNIVKVEVNNTKIEKENRKKIKKI
jgi:hypothetical protein